MLVALSANGLVCTCIYEQMCRSGATVRPIQTSRGVRGNNQNDQVAVLVCSSKRGNKYLLGLLYFLLTTKTIETEGDWSPEGKKRQRKINEGRQSYNRQRHNKWIRPLNEMILEFIGRAGDGNRYRDRRKRHTVATYRVRLCCSSPTTTTNSTPFLQQWVNRLITGWSV